jgi:vacuolar-type H+-ATPase subunit E/Vma4
LDELEELVEQGQGGFFSRVRWGHKAWLLDVDDVMDYTHQIRASLPQQIQRADQITREKDRILEEAREQAERMVTEAAEQAELTIRKAQDESRILVANHEITRLSTQEGQRIVEQARQEAEAMRQGALEYARNVLSKLNTSIDALDTQMGHVKKIARDAYDEIH